MENRLPPIYVDGDSDDEADNLSYRTENSAPEDPTPPRANGRPQQVSLSKAVKKGIKRCVIITIVIISLALYISVLANMFSSNKSMNIDKVELRRLIELKKRLMEINKATARPIDHHVDIAPIGTGAGSGSENQKPP